MTIKEQLMREIEQTPDVLLEEFLDFILFTKARRQPPISPDSPQPSATHWVDPLAAFIGATHPGNLAQGIDAALYE